MAEPQRACCRFSLSLRGRQHTLLIRASRPTNGAQGTSQQPGQRSNPGKSTRLRPLELERRRHHPVFDGEGLGVQVDGGHLRMRSWAHVRSGGGLGCQRASIDRCRRRRARGAGGRPPPRWLARVARVREPGGGCVAARSSAGAAAAAAGAAAVPATISAASNHLPWMQHLLEALEPRRAPLFLHALQHRGHHLRRSAIQQQGL